MWNASPFTGHSMSWLFGFMLKRPVVEHGYEQRSRLFLEDMRRLTNTWDLYRWARHQIKEAGGERMELDDLPGFVGWSTSKMPKQGIVEPNDGTPYVHLIWTNTRERWGLKVGSPSFAPATESGDYHLEWAPGVYAWHELSR